MLDAKRAVCYFEANIQANAFRAANNFSQTTAPKELSELSARLIASYANQIDIIYSLALAYLYISNKKTAFQNRESII